MYEPGNHNALCWGGRDGLPWAKSYSQKPDPVNLKITGFRKVLPGLQPRLRRWPGRNVCGASGCAVRPLLGIRWLSTSSGSIGWLCVKSWSGRALPRGSKIRDQGPLYSKPNRLMSSCGGLFSPKSSMESMTRFKMTSMGCSLDSFSSR